MPLSKVNEQYFKRLSTVAGEEKKDASIESGLIINKDSELTNEGTA